MLGDGPPVVFVNGAAADGDTSWTSLVPLVPGRLTCFLLSTRGRGLSADADDHSCERLAEDIASFADSIGEPVGLVGHSSGAELALAAAAKSEGVSGVAAYEPGVEALMDDTAAAGHQAAMGRALQAVSEMRMEDAARYYVEDTPLFNDEEKALMSAAGVFKLMAPYAPMWMQEIPEYLRAIADPSVIENISVPVLLLHGPRTHPWFTHTVRYLAAELADAHVVEISGAGHMGPYFSPDAVADELIRFFTAQHPLG